MAKLYFKPFRGTYASIKVYHDGSKEKLITPSLCYYDGEIKYIPLIQKTGSIDTSSTHFFYSSSENSITVRHNGITYVVPNKQSPLYTKFSGSIDSTSYSKSKLSTGSSGYYGATVRITWSASVKEEGVNSSSVELRYSITNQGLSYKETKSGTWSASSASSGNIATLLIDANGGNPSADVTINFYLYDTKNSATLATASLTIPDPWYFNDSSGSGGNTNPGE